MKYKLGQWLIGCFVTMVSLTTGAWSQPIEQLTINYIEVLSIPDQCVNQIHVYATVSDADDSSILGLPATAFKSIEDGREIDIDEVSKAIDPMSIVLAIDSSGSMQARDKSGLTSMEAAKNAAADFISRLGQNDRVAVYSFNNEPVLLMDFSNDHQAAVNTVKGLFAKQNAATCLYDTAYAAVKKAAEIPRGRRAIILLTDGKDEKAGRACSTYPSNDVIDIATTKTIRVPIYTIGVGPQVDARELGRMAGLTGGRSLLATSPAELQKFYQIIADQLKNQYLIKYFTRTASGEHSLVLKIEHEGRQVQDEKRFFSPPLPVAQPPAISFISPRSTDTVEGTVTVKTAIRPEKLVAKVRYYVDAGLKKEYTSFPFDTFTWDTAGLSSGFHILRVEAIGINGQTGKAEMTIKVVVPANSPIPVKKGMAWLSLILLLIVITGGVVVWWFFSRKAAGASIATEEDSSQEGIAEDEKGETIFMTYSEDKELVPPATVKVIKSLSLEAGTTFKVTDATRIGRGGKNDVDIPDQPVSRNHAEIYFYNGTFHIRDLGSRNGIKVDGRRIASDSTVLRSGAKIHFGPKTVLKFQCAALIKAARPDDKTKVYER